MGMPQASKISTSHIERQNLNERIEMAYDARQVANYFIDLAEQDHVSITPLKLQKLVYLAHGWSLALRGQPLIRQNPEAWKYGPVIPVIYKAFKEYGGSPITDKANLVPVGGQISDAEKDLIKSVWGKYKSLTAGQLSTLTHEPGSAWQATVTNSWPFEPLVISDALITDEFLRRLQKSQAHARPTN
jgi:uncharacterized phage-associated protein